MNNYEKILKKKQKTYKEKESESIHGKKQYRLRKTLEKEGTKLVREFKQDVI